MEFGDSVVEYRGSMVGGRAEFFLLAHGMHGIFSPKAQRPLVHGIFLSPTDCTDDSDFFFFFLMSSLTSSKIARRIYTDITRCARFFVSHGGFVVLTEFTECTEVTRCARVYSLQSTVYGWTRCARFFRQKEIRS